MSEYVLIFYTKQNIIDIRDVIIDYFPIAVLNCGQIFFHFQISTSLNNSGSDRIRLDPFRTLTQCTSQQVKSTFYTHTINYFSTTKF